MLLPVGLTVSLHAIEDFEALEREIKAHLASPSVATTPFLGDALKRLRAIPFDADPKRRVTCLLDVAWQFYHQGQSIFNGVEPAAFAVMLARDAGDRPLLREHYRFEEQFSVYEQPRDALTRSQRR